MQCTEHGSESYLIYLYLAQKTSFVAHPSELHETSDFNWVRGVEFEFAPMHVENLSPRGENGQIQDGRVY